MTPVCFLFSLNVKKDNIEKSGSYSFYCSDDEEGGGEPVTSCIQVITTDT